MKIGEVANETGLSISNIRFYEKKGLLTPSRKEESGYRDYTIEDVSRLKTILLYRKMGLPIRSRTYDELLEKYRDDKTVIVFKAREEADGYIEGMVFL